MLKVFSKNIPFFRCSSWYTWVCVFVRSDHFICIVVLSLPFSYVNTQTHRHSRKIRWANIWATWLSYFSSIQIFIEFDLLILCCLSVLETRSCAHAHAYARSLAHLPTKPFYQCVWLMQCVGMCFIGNSISLAFEKMRKRERERPRAAHTVYMEMDVNSCAHLHAQCCDCCYCYYCFYHSLIRRQFLCSFLISPFFLYAFFLFFLSNSSILIFIYFVYCMCTTSIVLKR